MSYTAPTNNLIVVSNLFRRHFLHLLHSHILLYSVSPIRFAYNRKLRLPKLTLIIEDNRAIESKIPGVTLLEYFSLLTEFEAHKDGLDRDMMNPGILAHLPLGSPNPLLSSGTCPAQDAKPERPLNLQSKDRVRQWRALDRTLFSSICTTINLRPRMTRPFMNPTPVNSIFKGLFHPARKANAATQI